MATEQMGTSSLREFFLLVFVHSPILKQSETMIELRHRQNYFSTTLLFHLQRSRCVFFYSLAPAGDLDKLSVLPSYLVNAGAKEINAD